MGEHAHYFFLYACGLQPDLRLQYPSGGQVVVLCLHQATLK